MNKCVSITSSIAFGDLYPKYSFCIYNEDIINIDNEDVECNGRRKVKKRLSPQELDNMSDKEIEDWYEYNGRYGYDG